MLGCLGVLSRLLWLVEIAAVLMGVIQLFARDWLGAGQWALVSVVLGAAGYGVRSLMLRSVDAPVTQEMDDLDDEPAYR